MVQDGVRAPERKGGTSPINIYIYKEECLFVSLSVLYAFGLCKRWRHQTFHGTPLGLEEGREGVSATIGVGEGGLCEISPRS